MKPISLIKLLAVPLVALATPSLANDEPSEKWLTADQVRADVALAEEAYSRVHPGYMRYASEAEMQAAWSAITKRADAQGGMALGNLYLALELALTNIRCDHTKAELPRAMREARIGQPLYLPFRWELIEGRGIIAIPGTETGLVAGDEILAIDGRPFSEMVSEVAGYIPVDGFTDWSRIGGISQSLEFMGGALDHFGMLLWDNGPTALLLVRSANGERREVQVERVSFKGWTALGGARGLNFKDSVDYQRIGENAGYLRIDTFVNYRDPIDPHTMLAPLFQSMANEERSTLILDLRENGGGSTDASQALASYLIEQAKPLKLSMRVATLDLSGLKQHLSSWDPRALEPDPRAFIANEDGTYTIRDGIMDDTAVIAPTENAFTGRLLVLTSSNNSSGSTNLLSILAQQDRTILIGEPTGGSAEGPTAGLLFTLTLPESGVRMRIPLFRYRNNVASFEKGLGVTPDISAPMTVDHYRAGRDPALDAAKALISAAASSGVEVEPLVSVADFAPLEGSDWSGQLEYLNYESDTRSTIPVRMVVSEPRRRSVPFGFIYPGEESANARDRLRISRDGRQINGAEITSRRELPNGTTVLVTEEAGRDARRAASVRMTYEFSASRFVIRKDVQFDGEAFFNRNKYELRR